MEDNALRRHYKQTAFAAATQLEIVRYGFSISKIGRMMPPRKSSVILR